MTNILCKFLYNFKIEVHPVHLILPNFYLEYKILTNFFVYPSTIFKFVLLLSNYHTFYFRLVVIRLIISKVERIILHNEKIHIHYIFNNKGIIELTNLNATF